MINREDVYKNHSVHLTISEAKEKTNSLLDNFKDNVPYAQIVNRCLLILDMLEDKLENGNLELVRVQWLDSINSLCINIRDNGINYESSQNLSHIDNIDSYSDELLEYLFRLNSVNNMPSDVNEAYKNYVERYHDMVKELISCIDQTKRELDSLKSTIDSNNSNSMSNLQELSDKIVQEQQRLDAFATTYQQQMNDDKQSFSTFKETLNKEFQESKTIWENNVSTIIESGNELQDDFSNSTSEQFEKFEQEKDTLINNYSKIFEKYKEDVRKMVGIINANTFSSKYREVADDAKKRSFKWHIVAIVSMLIVAGFAVYAFVCTTNTDTSWIKLVAKIFATGTLATLVAYAMTEATKHEKVERYARKIEMELVSIDPFIESLDDEKKTEIKKTVAEKIFNSPDDMGISKNDDKYGKRLERINTNLLKELIALISKISK